MERNYLHNESSSFFMNVFNRDTPIIDVEIRRSIDETYCEPFFDIRVFKANNITLFLYNYDDRTQYFFNNFSEFFKFIYDIVIQKNLEDDMDIRILADLFMPLFSA